MAAVGALDPVGGFEGKPHRDCDGFLARGRVPVATEPALGEHLVDHRPVVPADLQHAPIGLDQLLIGQVVRAREPGVGIGLGHPRRGKKGGTDAGSHHAPQETAAGNHGAPSV